MYWFVFGLLLLMCIKKTIQMKTRLLLLLSIFTLQINAQCWDKISSGAYHTIAIANNGTLWGWGYNNTGQVGCGNTTNQTSPVQIGTANDWVSIGTGYYHSFAIKSNGSLWAWGNNVDGQLGNGNNTNQLSPVQIGTSQWQTVTGGEAFTIAIKTNGTLWTWGVNTFGQIGDGTTTSRNTPFQVNTDTNWWKISAGRYNSYALKATKKLWAWGINNKSQIGDNSTTTRYLPVAVADTENFDNVIAGVNACYAITQNGDLKAWGAVNGTDVYAPYPFGYQATHTNWVDLKVGINHFVGTKNTNELFTWGTNNIGQLGVNSSSTPVLITTVSNLTNKIAANFYGSLVLNSSGQLYVTGQNHVGQFGTGTDVDIYGFISVSCPALSSSDFDKNIIISIHPNPVSNQLNISTPFEIQKLVIYDVAGKQVKYQEGNTTAIDVQDLKSGFYLLEVTINDKKEVSKFIKQ